MDTVLEKERRKEILAGLPFTPLLCLSRLPRLCVKHPFCLGPCPVCFETVDFLGELIVLGGEVTYISRVFLHFLCEVHK